MYSGVVGVLLTHTKSSLSSKEVWRDSIRVFEEGRVLPDKVEQCFRAHPSPDYPYCECVTCLAMSPLAGWIVKVEYAAFQRQGAICCKSDCVEVMYY